MQAIFHIGYPKTGTTFLQGRVFPKLAQLAFSGPGKFATDLQHKELVDAVYRNRPCALDLATLPKQDFLISDERLSKTLTKSSTAIANLAKIARGCEVHGFSVSVVISIRRPSDILLSTYLGEIRNATDYSTYEDFAEAAMAVRNDWVADLHYKNVLHRLKEAGLKVECYRYEDVFEQHRLDGLETCIGHGISPVFLTEASRHDGKTDPSLKKMVPNSRLYQMLPKRRIPPGLKFVARPLKKILMGLSTDIDPEVRKTVQSRVDSHFALQDGSYPVSDGPSRAR